MHMKDDAPSSSPPTSISQQQNSPVPPILEVKVLAMGVGTKFLSEQVLYSEQDVDQDGTSTHYGTRVRDCHAEVLCRRAFRMFLLDCIQRYEILHDKETKGFTILQRCDTAKEEIMQRNEKQRGTQERSQYELRSDVTLHMYCSSTPCGNSTIKKFATLHKEQYCTVLSQDMYPSNEYHHLKEPIIGHSIPLGQFALLVKKDNQQQPSPSPLTSCTKGNDLRRRPVRSGKEKMWPIHTTTDWCPPGTTTVWSNHGSIHTCSDKMARWNYLGYQGSILSSYLQEPLYIATLTVGRKFSSVTCRRAVCCRLDVTKAKTSTKLIYSVKTEENENDLERTKSSQYNTGVFQLHHPTVMGTSVYMDDKGVIETSNQSLSSIANQSSLNAIADDGEGRSTISPCTNGEIRFHSPMSFVTWLRHEPIASSNTTTIDEYEMECIDGSTGFVFDRTNCNGGGGARQPSQICSFSFLNRFLRFMSFRPSTDTLLDLPKTLEEYRKLKRKIAPPYENTKDIMLTKHPVLRDWKRRYDDTIQIESIKNSIVDPNVNIDTS
jgi:Adenosine-deaminase (editase) domain